MKLIRCEKGHFYDAEKYDTCPHCSDNGSSLQKNSAKTNAYVDVALPLELSLFKTREMLGEGQTSKVFRLTQVRDYALKVVEITGEKAEHMVDNEYRIACLLDNERYFVRYYALYKQDGKAYIVQPELRNLLVYMNEERPDFRQILKILEDVAQAIVIMQEKGIVHLDVKPTNIFVDAVGHGILGDFSTACEIVAFKEKPFCGGTPKYFPPEVYQVTGYSGKEDMYSFGITMYYILSGGKYPYDFEESVTRTEESEYITNENIPDEFQSIIKKTTAYNPDDRYDSMAELCEGLHLACQESGSYRPVKTSAYCGADIACSCVLTSVEPEYDQDVLPDNIPETAELSPSDRAQNRRRALGEALRKGELDWVKEDGSVSYDSVTSPAQVESEGVVQGPKMVGGNNAGIQVPPGKLAPGACFCRVCGAKCSSIDVFCTHCGSRLADIGGVTDPPCNPANVSFTYTGETNVLSQHVPLEISKVHFSAIAPRTLIKGDYTIIDIVMYQDTFRSVVDELIKEAEAPVQETKSGVVKVKEGAKVKIQLTSPDITIEDNVEEQEWVGEYLTFNFAVMLPEKYSKRQVLFTATVYIDDVIATRLKFIAKCRALRQQKIKVTQEDVLSAFVSYASQDRSKVAMIIQGMQKARPDMDIFFDVESLRSGESWEDALWSEIDQRDMLFLCWSHNAAESPWVAREWKYCYERKGAEAIEPIPLEPPSSCPPPEELKNKHFNDRLLYVIKAESKNRHNSAKAEQHENTWSSFEWD